MHKRDGLHVFPIYVLVSVNSSFNHPAGTADPYISHPDLEGHVGIWKLFMAVTAAAIRGSEL